MNGINEVDPLLSDIYYGFTAFQMPYDLEEKRALTSLFEKLVSKPLSRQLVTDLAYSNRPINMIHGDGYFRYTYGGSFFPSHREIAVPLKRNTSDDQVMAVFEKRNPWTALLQWRYGGALTLREMPDYIILAHELIHAYHRLHGKHRVGEPAGTFGYKDLEEENTIVGVPGLVDYTENAIRKEFGLRERKFHFGVLARQNPQRAPGHLMMV